LWYVFFWMPRTSTVYPLSAEPLKDILATRLPSDDVCMKYTAWSLVPFQVGDTATPIRPPSPPVP